MWFFAVLISLFAVVGCQKPEDKIQTYRVSKEEASATVQPMPAAGTDMNAMGAQMGLSAAASAKELRWKTPSGWKEQPASSMRVASFLVQGADHRTADVSVVPLAGDAGGDLSNINRWRGQINLKPLADPELSANSQSIDAAGRSMRLVDFTSDDLLIDGRYKKRIVAAIYQQSGRTWFFKMIGDDETVAGAKSAFLTFLKNLRFNAS